ncbi:MAG: RNA polymerase sporulation sigma factor SigK [Ruminococcaceae bacterium]|nr:RNA polymerase sporulation sigma factor SigK [Oscillospiraceae bacterium]
MFSSIAFFLVYLLRYGAFLLSYVSNNTNAFPRPLSPKEESEYLALAQQGDTDAKNKLIEHNLRLVAHVAKKYNQIPSTEADDLISIGTIGLIKGISSYNDSKKTKLATYAARCIENEILMYIRSGKKLQNEISLNECLGHDSDGNEITFMDILTAEDVDVAELADLNIDKKKLYQYIDEVLNEREKEIICLRYGLAGKPITQRQIAKNMNISRSYVSRIEKKALQKLSARFSEKA